MSSTPESPTAEALDHGITLTEPESRPAGDGWTWIQDGWQLFMRAPLMWVISVIIMFIIMMLVNLVPFLGALAYQVLQGVLLGGFFVACRAVERKGEFELEYLFAGFTKRFAPLAILGLLMLVGWIIVFLVFSVFVGFSALTAFIGGGAAELPSWETAAGSIGMILIGSLVALLMSVPLFMAYWFAPALVMLHDVKPVDALKQSFIACVRNIVPFLIYSLVLGVAFVIALVPFGLGLLVWVPLLVTSTYVAYRRIFTAE
jgi:hypothetical protein